MPIDYSKWDNLDEYSDDDDEVKESLSSGPHVTRLDAPSKVTFGGGGASVEPSKPKAMISSATIPSTTNSRPPSRNQNWIQKGGLVTTSSNQNLFWSQDRYTVSLRLVLNDDAKIRTVQVDGILPYSDRHCAMGSEKPRLKIVNKSNRCLLEGYLPHHVHLAQQEDEIDWSVERDGTQRFVLICLYKAVPMEGVFVWWRHPLTQFPEIDIEHDASSAAKSQEFLKAWEEAHRTFREKKRSQGS